MDEISFDLGQIHLIKFLGVTYKFIKQFQKPSIRHHSHKTMHILREHGAIGFKFNQGQKHDIPQDTDE